MQEEYDVLVVDDEKNILNSLKRLFQIEDIQVFTTDDPVEALSMVRENRIKVIVSDFRMPQINGVDLLVKCREIRPETKRVILTGQIDMVSVIESINKVQLFNFITKPWDDKSLLLIIREAITQFDLIEENKRLNQQNLEQIEEMKKLDKLKSEFIANVSHELRTPVNCISLALSNIYDGVAGDFDSFPEKLRKYLDKVQVNLETLRVLIDDLLDIFKLNEEGYSLNHEYLQMSAVVEEEVNAIAELAQSKQISIEENIDSDIKAVIDATRIKQVIRNLISNALKFTDAGGTIKISLKKEKELAVCSVEDNGSGIEESEREKIFDRFHQIEEKSKGKPKGTGLGLAISRKIVELHGGSIWVEAAAVKGSCFIFTIPIKTGEER